MSNLLPDFDIDAKNPLLVARQRWKSTVSIVKNRAPRFPNIRDLVENENKSNQKTQARYFISLNDDRIRRAMYAQKAALHMHFDAQREYILTDEIKQAGFSVEPDELADMVRNHEIWRLTTNGSEAEGIAEKVSASLTEGIRSSEAHIRKNIYGENRFTEKPARSFLMFVWRALQNTTDIFIMVCALVSIVVGLVGVAFEGLPKGMYNGMGILLSVIFGVMVTAVSDYKQSLELRDLDREKYKINIQVTQDGNSLV